MFLAYHLNREQRFEDFSIEFNCAMKEVDISFIVLIFCYNIKRSFYV